MVAVFCLLELGVLGGKGGELLFFTPHLPLLLALGITISRLCVVTSSASSVSETGSRGSRGGGGEREVM